MPLIYTGFFAQMNYCNQLYAVSTTYIYIFVFKKKIELRLV